MKRSKHFIFVLLCFLSVGCQTVSPSGKPQESREDTERSLKTVAEGVTGKSLTEDEWKNLEHQLKTDKEAQSAVGVMTGAVAGEGPNVKYCPVGGERYSARVDICPVHAVELKPLE